jgi:hypothetical protein
LRGVKKKKCLQLSDCVANVGHRRREGMVRALGKGRAPDTKKKYEKSDTKKKYEKCKATI